MFTHDMDFSALLAVTGAAGPSVLQVRVQDTLLMLLGGMSCGYSRCASQMCCGGRHSDDRQRSSHVLRVLPIFGD